VKTDQDVRVTSEHMSIEPLAQTLGDVRHTDISRSMDYTCHYAIQEPPPYVPKFTFLWVDFA